MAGILELSDENFETTMISMLRTLMDKIYSIEEQMNNVIRDKNLKRELKRNARDKNHCKGN